MLDRSDCSYSLTGDLRADLRGATAHAHGELDATVMGFDLSTRGGMAAFLRGSARAMAHVAPILDTLPLPDCAPLTAALKRDLDILGIAGGLARVPAAPAPDGPGAALGVYYVVAGSRLGAQVLLRDQSTRDDPVLRAATHYLSAPAGREMWASFRYHLAENDPNMNPRAVIDGALWAFAVFGESFRGESTGPRDDEPS